MCGFAGIFHPEGGSADELARLASAMAARLAHRGPDDAGVWCDAKAGIAVGHRRLAILDASSAGHQPMHSADGRYVIVYNGEVYNFLDLRRELESKGHKFRGRSDTEVVLAAISAWGLETAVEKFNGMFAFAVWDRDRRILSMARDRIGIKPLYYGWVGRWFLFGSELKALSAHPSYSPEVDSRALALYFRYGYVPHPYSIIRGIFKLPPGTTLSLSAGRHGQPGDENLRLYWSAQLVAEAAAEQPFQGSLEEAGEHLDDLLREAVRRQAVADVPIGTFLSGGIDSSTVSSLMQRTSASPVQSFTTGFWDVRYDEAKYAKKVATLLGTEHHEIYVDAPEAMAVISKLPAIYDEPFSDVSQIPTSLISVHARRNVKVVLSGDGGDEIFGGYVRYLLAMRLWLWARRTPDWLKVALARSIKSLPTNFYSACFGFLSPWVKRYSDPGPLGDKIHKLADILEACPADGLDQWLGSHWKEQIIKTGDGGLPPWRRSVGNADLEGFARRMMLNDLEAYLPDDVLTKVDRASMAVGLEVRVPLLDHRVVEFAAQLPLSMKIRNGRGKLVLRHVLSRYLPKDLVERPKAGFGVPVAEWLRGPLKDWASDMLSEYKLRQEGWLDSAAVLAKWKEHLSRRRNWEYPLWTVLMFEAWLGENLKAVRPQVAPVEHVQ